MRHPVRDRLLIILICLMLLGASVVLVGTVTGLIPQETLQQFLDFFSTQQQAVRIGASITAAVLVILCVLLFTVILPKRKGNRSAYAIQQVEHGELKISIKALEHLVAKCLAQHPEMNCTASTITSNEQSVRVDLRVTLQSDINIPLATAALQKQIKQYVEACSGVDVDEVRVVVEGTTPITGEVSSPYAIPEMLQPRLQARLPGAQGEGQMAQEAVKPQLFPEQEVVPQPAFTPAKEPLFTTAFDPDFEREAPQPTQPSAYQGFVQGEDMDDISLGHLQSETGSDEQAQHPDEPVNLPEADGTPLEAELSLPQDEILAFFEEEKEDDLS